MAGTNLGVLREAIAAMNRGDVEAVVSFCTEDISFSPLRAALTGAFIGHDGVRAFWRDTEETFDKFIVKYDTFEELPDGRILATGTFITRGRGSTAETDVHSAAVFTFRDGKVCEMFDHGDAATARRALET